VIANKVSDDKLASINDRITRIESIALGGRVSAKDATDNTMLVIAIIGALVGIAGIVLVMINMSHHRPP
jgi:hypothetical protein